MSCFQASRSDHEMNRMPWYFDIIDKTVCQFLLWWPEAFLLWMWSPVPLLTSVILACCHQTSGSYTEHYFDSKLMKKSDSHYPLPSVLLCLSLECFIVNEKKKEALIVMWPLGVNVPTMMTQFWKTFVYFHFIWRHRVIRGKQPEFFHSLVHSPNANNSKSPEFHPELLKS